MKKPVKRKTTKSEAWAGPFPVKKRARKETKPAKRETKPAKTETEQQSEETTMRDVKDFIEAVKKVAGEHPQAAQVMSSAVEMNAQLLAVYAGAALNGLIVVNPNNQTPYDDETLASKALALGSLMVRKHQTAFHALLKTIAEEGVVEVNKDEG